MMDVTLTGRLTKMCAYDAAQDIVNQLAGHEYGTALKIIEQAKRTLMNNLVVQQVKPFPQITQVDNTESSFGRDKTDLDSSCGV